MKSTKNYRVGIFLTVQTCPYFRPKKYGPESLGLQSSLYLCSAGRSCSWVDLCPRNLLQCTPGCASYRESFWSASIMYQMCQIWKLFSCNSFIENLHRKRQLVEVVRGEPKQTMKKIRQHHWDLERWRREKYFSSFGANLTKSSSLIIQLMLYITWTRFCNSRTRFVNWKVMLGTGEFKLGDRRLKVGNKMESNS